jgi:hypothetical protein
MEVKSNNQYSPLIDLVWEDLKLYGGERGLVSGIQIHPAISNEDDFEELTVERCFPGSFVPVVPVMGTKRYWTVRWKDKEWVISARKPSTYCYHPTAYSWFQDCTPHLLPLRTSSDRYTHHHTMPSSSNNHASEPVIDSSILIHINDTEVCHCIEQSGYC